MYSPGDLTDSPVNMVRLLIADTNPASEVFTDTEITAFLTLENGDVKLAAAQALDTIADDEALTSKAVRTQDLSTDGTKVADSLRRRAAALRAQASAAATDTDDGFTDIGPLLTVTRVPELTSFYTGI